MSGACESNGVCEKTAVLNFQTGCLHSREASSVEPMAKTRPVVVVVVHSLRLSPCANFYILFFYCKNRTQKDVFFASSSKLSKMHTNKFFLRCFVQIIIHDRCREQCELWTILCHKFVLLFVVLETLTTPTLTLPSLLSASLSLKFLFVLCEPQK